MIRMIGITVIILIDIVVFYFHGLLGVKTEIPWSTPIVIMILELFLIEAIAKTKKT
jgi:hypothetical protein